MPNWRAVGFGAAVAVLLAFFGVLVPVLGHAMLGVAAGFVAGALAGGGARPGAVTGLTTGVVGGFLVTVLGLAIAGTVGLGSPIAAVLSRVSPGFEALFALSAPIVVGVGAVTVVLMAGVGGLIGGVLRGDKPLPALPPEERNRDRR